jgi:hypothetical protein
MNFSVYSRSLYDKKNISMLCFLIIHIVNHCQVDKEINGSYQNTVLYHLIASRAIFQLSGGCRSEGSFTCHTFCDTGPQFIVIRSHLKDRNLCPTVGFEPVT